MAQTSSSLGWKRGNLPPGVRPGRLGPPLFDARNCTAHHLQDLMTAGKLKSVDLVEEYIWQIEEHNGYLHAVSEYASNVMEAARSMDAKRDAGVVLGPLHGIPVLLKNIIGTHPDLGMETDAGAAALIGARPAKNAPVVERLIAAGAVILGKTTVSELSFHKGAGLFCGWSAVGGQGQSPYVRGGCEADDTVGGHSVPGGSSSGSSIAVAAGFCPVGIGADTHASITAAAVRASLYSMRPSTGLVSAEGLVPLARSFDTPGPMTKDVRDLADVLTAIVDPSKTEVPEGGFASALHGDWKTVRVGTVDPEIWNLPPGVCKPVPEASVQLLKDTKDTYERIGSLAAVFHNHVDLGDGSAWMLNGVNVVTGITDVEFVEEINDYLSSLPESRVRDLKELVQWNKDNAAEALPPGASSQSRLEEGLKLNCSEEYVKPFHEHRIKEGSRFDAALEKHGIDVIVSPGDSFFSIFASAKGYPIAALPMSYLDYNGRPTGLQATALRHKEDVLLQFLSAYEASFPPRQAPSAFIGASDTPTNERHGQL